MIQEALTTETTPGTFEQLDAAAFEHMEREGYALIRGFVPEEFCDAALRDIEQEYFVPSDVFSDHVTGRREFSDPDDTAQRDKLDAIVEQAVKAVAAVAPDTLKSLWQYGFEEGFARMQEDMYWYKDGSVFQKHVDDQARGFPTQAIVTLRGRATFSMFANLQSEEPFVDIDFRQGDLLLVRGDDLPGGQLPHAITEIADDRTMISCYPNQKFEEKVAEERAKNGSLVA